MEKGKRKNVKRGKVIKTFIPLIILAIITYFPYKSIINIPEWDMWAYNPVMPTELKVILTIRIIGHITMSLYIVIIIGKMIWKTLLKQREYEKEQRINEMAEAIRRAEREQKGD